MQRLAFAYMSIVEWTRSQRSTSRMEHLYVYTVAVEASRMRRDGSKAGGDVVDRAQRQDMKSRSTNGTAGSESPSKNGKSLLRPEHLFFSFATVDISFRNLHAARRPNHGAVHRSYATMTSTTASPAGPYPSSTPSHPPHTAADPSRSCA